MQEELFYSENLLKKEHWFNQSGWLQIVFHVGTENREEKLKRTPCLIELQVMEKRGKPCSKRSPKNSNGKPKPKNYGSQPSKYGSKKKKPGITGPKKYGSPKESGKKGPKKYGAQPSRYEREEKEEDSFEMYNALIPDAPDH